MFGCIWDNFDTTRNSVQNGTKCCSCCKSSNYEVTSKFFATNTPDPHHWTLNSCFGVFHTVLVHLAPFITAEKQGVKRVELVQLIQKFLPQCHAGTFHNKHTRSTPLESKLLVYFLMFGCISDCFVSGRNLVQNGVSWYY
jgi:hypothetical protein